MVDFLGAGCHAELGGWCVADDHYDKALAGGAEVYRKSLEVVREAAGADTYLLSSSGPSVINCPYVTAVRTGNDYGEGRSLYPDTNFYPATYRLNDPDSWNSHRRASDNMAAHYFTHRKLFINDINVMTVDKPLPLADARTTATLFALSGGPIMIGDDLDRMSGERLAILKKCLPRTSEIARPLDLFTSVQPHDYPHIFHLPVEASWDRWHLLAVVNYGDAPRTERIAPGDLGIEPGTDLAVWDVWNERYLHHTGDEIVVRAQPADVTLLRIAARRPHPWIAATDMHLVTGKVEIADAAWDERRMVLTFTCARPRGERGSVFVTAPPGYRVEDFAECYIAKDGVDGTLIVRREIAFERDTEKAELRFSHC
jgi:hypothetical protein